jgi:hypothetical protein
MVRGRWQHGQVSEFGAATAIPTAGLGTATAGAAALLYHCWWQQGFGPRCSMSVISLRPLRTPMATLDRVFQVVFARYRRKASGPNLDSAWRRAANRVSGYVVLPVASVTFVLVMAAHLFTNSRYIYRTQTHGSNHWRTRSRGGGVPDGRSIQEVFINSPSITFFRGAHRYPTLFVVSCCCRGNLYFDIPKAARSTQTPPRRRNCSNSLRRLNTQSAAGTIERCESTIRPRHDATLKSPKSRRSAATNNR